ncbi:hypothetical protein AD006_31055 (plasmid) [Pseudonocardia sp. EC080610-09]|uniref:alpha/beta fold hydrolase n=1 Tax=unclassified Pseudonocardia TaxID=2619320 RepID=UPI000706AA7F|nr:MULTISPECIES: alpha/beta fold hydrolase [unclassified Pseudonocardia]ALL79629.1 hypothetical protein AD006_31055 [Pseudonocardia sp. EC080610-09]ALL85414.1 hypothetical protein AD017_30175 [Pseudonocardia sp. EC080619-01]
MPDEDTSTPIPPHTLSGVPDAEISEHRFPTADGLELSMLRFTRDRAGDAVLLVHGHTTSTDMFVMPEHRNLVTTLLDHGYDVWSLDFRLSNRHTYNRSPERYTLDDCALYDFPPALDLLRTHIGDRPLHVVAHCVGALTFSMSLAARRIGGLTSAVLNSVSLLPRVPRWSALKLAAGPTLFSLAGIELLDPRWSTHSGSLPHRLLAGAVSLAHRECDVRACQLLSMMWGAGRPAMYQHHNLDPQTHRRVADLFGPTSLQFYRHMHQMVRAEAAVKYRPHRASHRILPANYLQAAASIEIPILFTTGTYNRVFCDSNIACHERLRRLGARQHELAVFDGYGHQDVFMGRDAARDVFGDIVEFLSRTR